MSKYNLPEAIKVTYKFIDGAHFFVSDDKRAQGLCVAHVDMKTAYEEVAYQLSAIKKFNDGVTVEFLPAVPYEQFAKIIHAYDAVGQAANVGESITPSAIQAWQIAKIKERVKEPA